MAVRIHELGCEFDSLAEALAQARPGFHLSVEPGRYDEALVIACPVQVEGRGTVIVSQAVSVQADARLRGLTLSGPVAAQAGRFHQCEMETGLEIQGEVEARHCQISGRVTLLRAQGLFEDCRIGRVSATLSDLRLLRCQLEGRLFLRMAKGMAEDTSLSGGGVEVRGARLVLRGCQVRDPAVGLLIQSESRCTAEHCDFLDSRTAAVELLAPSFLYLWHCRLLRGQGSGARSGINTRLIMENCELSQYSGAAVSAERSGRVDLRHCLITENAVGVRLEKGGSVWARHCSIARNQEAWSVADDPVTLELEECELDSVERHRFSGEERRRVSEDELLQLLGTGVRELRGRNLEATTLSLKSLGRVNLRGLDFSGADLSTCLVSDLDLSGCRFVGANLQGTTISRSLLDEANFEGARMNGARIYECWMSGANLSRVDLSEGNVTLLGPSQPLNLTEARLLRTRLSGSLQGTRLVRARGRKADLSGSWLTGCDFSGADLQGARLGSSLDASQVNFRDANLRSADLSHRPLGGTNFQRCDLRSASFDHADLSEADLRAARLGPNGWLHTRLTGVAWDTSLAREVHAHQEYLHRKEREARTRPKSTSRAQKAAGLRVRQLALSAFGNDVESALDQAGRVGSIVLVKGYLIPPELASILPVEVDFFAKSPHSTVPTRDHDAFYESLGEFAWRFCGVEQGARPERLTFGKAEFERWAGDRLGGNVGLVQQALFGPVDRVDAFRLDSSTLVIGHSCALSFRGA